MRRRKWWWIDALGGLIVATSAAGFCGAGYLVVTHGDRWGLPWFVLCVWWAAFAVTLWALS